MRVMIHLLTMLLAALGWGCECENGATKRDPDIPAPAGHRIVQQPSASHSLGVELGAGKSDEQASVTFEHVCDEESQDPDLGPIAWVSTPSLTRDGPVRPNTAFTRAADMHREDVSVAAVELELFKKEARRVVETDQEENFSFERLSELDRAAVVIGTTRNPAWAPLLEDVWEAAREARHKMHPMDFLNARKTFPAAWVDLMWPIIESRGRISWVRDAWAEDLGPGTLQISGVSLAFQRTVADIGWSSPEVAALFDDPNVNVRMRVMYQLPMRGEMDPAARLRWLGLIEDPDPELRQTVMGRISTQPLGRDVWVEPLRRFLERDDLSPDARETAMRALEVRGWTVEQTAEAGVRVVRLPSKVPGTPEEERFLRRMTVY